MGILHNSYFQEQLRNNLSEATSSVVILSAFVKLNALHWLKQTIPSIVQDVVVVTRWRFNDIVSGASDLSAYEFARDNSWIFSANSNMHYKIYLIDNRFLFLGSANLTQSGLHLGLKGNDEASVQITPSKTDLLDLEQYISSCCTMDDNLFSQMKSYVEQNRIVQDVLKSQSWPSEINDRLVPPINQLWVKNLLFNPPLTINRKQCDFIEQDLLLLGLSNVEDLLDKERTLSALRSTIVWRWLIKTIEDSEHEFVKFGELSANLHSDLVDDPKPYRRDVKTFLVNLYEWVRYLDPPELGLKKFNKTEALFLKN